MPETFRIRVDESTHWASAGLESDGREDDPGRARGPGQGLSNPAMEDNATGPYRTSSSDTSRQRVSVDQAARTLGLSVDAVRKRVQRGTIPYEKDRTGRVTIILDTIDTLQDKVQDVPGPGVDRLLEAKDETIKELRDRVRYLEVESRRKDHLLAAALERIPAIEAPQEATESPESAGEGSDTRCPGPPPMGRRSKPRRARGGGGCSGRDRSKTQKHTEVDRPVPTSRPRPL